MRGLPPGMQTLGPLLVVVEQPNTTGALPIAVAKDAGCEVEYRPGLRMRNAAVLYSGRGKDRRVSRTNRGHAGEPQATPVCIG